MPPLLRPAEVTTLRDAAAQVLLGNRKEGWDPRHKTDYAYVCPSRTGGYPWQWFWDSCFHAIVLCHIDVKLAQQELRTLWKAQHPDGFIPHVVHWGARFTVNPLALLQSRLSWRPKSTALIQPPVLAQAALAVAERSQDQDFIAEAADRVRRYYIWLRDQRDPDADRLISVITPYETGMDHLPAFDEALGARDPSRLGLQARDRLLDLHNLVRGRNYNLDVIFRRDRFNVEDVLVNCLYAQGLRAASRLFVMTGDDPSAESLARMAHRTEQAVLTKLYDKSAGAFWGLSGKAETPLKTLTIASLLPVVLESIGPDQVEELVQRHILNEDEFWLPYPLPSVARCEPSFRPSARFLLWRGPTWINTNWLIAGGLRRHGYTEIADTIARKSAELALKSGFREFYNPFTGEGYGAREFGWSTLIVDML
ncbi:MAG: hypothetical protein V3V35_11075 [Dehalococcoidia bacterium]